MNEQAPPLPTNSDIETLKLLSIFHYVVGGLQCLGICFGGFYAFMGLMIGTTASHQHGGPPPAFGLVFVAFGLFFALVAIIIGTLTIISGLKMRKRHCRTFSIVVASINCMFLPFGTVLGIFTIIVLMRDSVRRLYAEVANGGNSI